MKLRTEDTLRAWLMNDACYSDEGARHTIKAINSGQTIHFLTPNADHVQVRRSEDGTYLAESVHSLHPQLDIDPAAPDEDKTASLAGLIGAWTDTDHATASHLACECFRHGRDSGYRAALAELAGMLHGERTDHTDSVVSDTLAAYGITMHIDHGRWRL